MSANQLVKMKYTEYTILHPETLPTLNNNSKLIPGDVFAMR